jgi:hypothetical protein
MRSRSWPERAALALGAVVEGIWCGALAAALAGASWVALTAFAALTILAGALVARRLDEGKGAGGVRAARLLALGLILAATGVLLVAGRAWAPPSLLWQVARDFVYAGGLVLVGIYLGRAAEAPDVAVRRAVRGFALLCIILVTAALAGSAPAWVAWAVVAALIAGGLLVAVARYRDLIDLVDPAERMPAWPWLLAVAGAVLLVVAVGALLSLAFRVDAILSILHVVGGALRYALDGVAYAFVYAAAALMRGLSWVLGLFHVRAWHGKWAPPLKPKLNPELPLNGKGFRFPSAGKLVGTIAGAVLVIGALLALVVVSLRRIRREPSAEVMVVEEREELTSLRTAAGQFAGRLGRRLRSRFDGLFRRETLTPAELVRRRYAELERRLSRAGRPRLPGVTVREYLKAGAAVPDVVPGSPPPDAVPGSPSPDAVPAASPPDVAPPPRAAADLAGIYELARYSARTIDVAQVRRFEALAGVFEV